MITIRVLKLSAAASCLAMAVLAYVGGCTQNSRIVQDQYRLDVARVSNDRQTRGQGVLKVRRFVISSPFETHEFVYRKAESRYVSDFYNRFLSPPAGLITEEVRQWLSESGVFANVVGAFSGVDYDYMLEGDILAVYGDHRGETESNAVMEIEFMLIDEHLKKDIIIFNRKYRSVQPTDDKSASSLAEGLNACLVEILTNLEADLRRLPRKVQ
ncbi:MAG: hypothetical protein DRP66_02895 [Planctomycetota bacterium]|nr:MAG: hypothetical protein DRP66_02895 [Planctomycetota bacterium]